MKNYSLYAVYRAQTLSVVPRVEEAAPNRQYLVRETSTGSWRTHHHHLRRKGACKHYIVHHSCTGGLRLICPASLQNSAIVVPRITAIHGDCALVDLRSRMPRKMLQYEYLLGNSASIQPRSPTNHTLIFDHPRSSE